MKSIYTKSEISYLTLIRLIMARKFIILISVLVFFLGGMLVLATTSPEYESVAVTLSESEGSNANPSQFGGLAGVRIPQQFSQEDRSTFSPEMFPDILSSRAFLHGLINERFFFLSKGKEMTLKEYYLEERPANALAMAYSYIVGFPNRLAAWIVPSQEEWVSAPLAEEVDGQIVEKVRRVSAEEEYATAQLRKRIVLENRRRILTLKVRAPEPDISAELNDLVLDKLILFATQYKTEKQRKNLEFIEQQALEAEQNFRDAQFALASFRDANQGIVSQKAKTHEEYLQAEFNLAFNVYNSLKQEEEQTKIQLKKETPIFTTIEPAVVPLSKAEPRVSFIITVSLFLGFFSGIVVILFTIVRDFFKGSITYK